MRKQFSGSRRTFFWLLILAFLAGFSIAKVEDISLGTVREAGRLLGFSFSQAELENMMPSVRMHRQAGEAISDARLDNSVTSALEFDPLPRGFELPVQKGDIPWELPEDVFLPENPDELAYYSIPELAALLKNREITSEELTLFFLNRLEEHGETLEGVVTITRDRALQQARKADREIAAGNYRGPLHGIPYGVKDLLAVEGYPTTWGAMPFKDQVIDYTASVVEQLDEAGAVLTAKLTMGALAMGDVWFGGKTRNPWNLEDGSSGSSAGSAAAVSAGLLPFALGTETLGSIVSPSTRCGVTGLRPTYGRVSRDGAMALSWSMDKIGPLARSAEECAMVLEVINGPDGKDRSLVDAGFNYDPDLKVTDLRVGYIAAFFEQEYPGVEADNQVLTDLSNMGVELKEVEWGFQLPVNALRIILYAESAAAFDELTVSGRDSLLVNQAMNAWPNLFRGARFIPAVDYINANRVRSLLVEEVNELMKDYDVVVTPSYGGNQLLVTNLTGHPAIAAPNGFTEGGSPLSITFLGQLYGEGKVVSLVKAWQEYSGHHAKRPPLFDPL